MTDTLRLGSPPLEFSQLHLRLGTDPAGNAFSRFTSVTVADLVSRDKYRDLAARVTARYSDRLDEPIRAFLLGLKQAGDTLYRSFLNQYGDDLLCSFGVEDVELARAKVLYVYTAGSAAQPLVMCWRTRRPSRTYAADR